jgi:hypothetical protein
LGASKVKQWSAHTLSPSIGPGTALLIFEETIAGSPIHALNAGDAISITVGGATSVMVRGDVMEAGPESAVISMSDGTKWTMTPRRSDEPLAGVIWTSSPTQEWVIRSAA